MDDGIETIIEGCYPDTPMSIMCVGIEELIPKNVNLLLSDHEIHPHRYLLYARTEDFSTYEINQNPYIERMVHGRYLNPHKLFTGGWPLNDNINNFRWIFDAQRSLTTRDGRIYINSVHFQDGWRFYLDKVPLLLKDCKSIFERDCS